MYDIYVCYCGQRIKLDHGPIDLRGAYEVVEDDHIQTVADLELILSKPSMSGLHDAIRERMNNGDDYEVVNELTHNVVRKVHVVY